MVAYNPIKCDLLPPIYLIFIFFLCRVVVPSSYSRRHRRCRQLAVVVVSKITKFTRWRFFIPTLRGDYFVLLLPLVYARYFFSFLSSIFFFLLNTCWGKITQVACFRVIFLRYYGRGKRWFVYGNDDGFLDFRGNVNLKEHKRLLITRFMVRNFTVGDIEDIFSSLW